MTTANTPDDELITLPFFLGRRTIREFRRMFTGVLAFSLPLVIVTWGYQYVEERAILPKIIASSSIASDMHHLGRAANSGLQRSTTSPAQLALISKSLEESLTVLQGDEPLAALWGESSVREEHTANIAALVQQAQAAGQRIAQLQEKPRAVKQLTQSLAEEVSRYEDTLRTTALFRASGAPSPAELETWDALDAMAALTKQWGQQLRSGKDTAATVKQMRAELAAWRGRAPAVVLALSNPRTAMPKALIPSEHVEKLMQTARSIEELAGDLQNGLDGTPDVGSLALQIEAGSEQVDAEVRALHDALQSGLYHDGAEWVADILLRALMLLAVVGLLYLRFSKQDHAQRQDDNLRQNAILQLQWAEAATQEARQANEAVQLAIFRLMQELQEIASGDLTKHATVSEDLTGGIADAINYTVDELRALVAGVLRTAERVTSTTAQVDATSLVLLESSRNQLAAMRGAGQSVSHLAGQVDAVSVQAQASAEVARQSRAAAETGLAAVQESMSSINTLRDHVHETSKRIKRLGESSQEIGEITALIAEITAQTNLLAVNAAIQAASAGEAGRGFSVVAEEVGQLAERCAQAARQITTLVIAIQTDAQNAISAMERSAQSVVEGTLLSDRAGLALNDINQLSEDVSARIENIATVASQESKSAKEVAQAMRDIVGLIEQTSHGTQLNADKVRSLRSAAADLRDSVARFNVA